jgi:hypothetical protein
MKTIPDDAADTGELDPRIQQAIRRAASLC